METFIALAGLFGVSFVAATIFPAQSEAALIGLQLAGYPIAALIAVATLGNTLGAIVNWALGRGARRFQNKRWFPVSARNLDRASAWYLRWGRSALLLSWAPIVGDAITVAAGVLKEPLWSFVILVAIAKFGRYAFLAAATAGIVG